MANTSAATPLARRIESTLKAGRWNQAVELAKQFARQTPGPASLSLLKKCYLALAESQIAHSAFREATATVAEAEKLSNNEPSWLESLAELRADLGDLAGAQIHLEKIPGSTARPRIVSRVVDRAMLEGAAGKAILPDDLRPQFDIVRQAFADYEAGKDDIAREKLNAIGLTSPFLEWKLLLRGLIAWSANDSMRAIENWSRLTANRLPAKLAEPFRIGIDKIFASSLPAARLIAAARQADSFSGGLVSGLRQMRKQLANDETISSALETARAVVPELRRIAPELVPRLANIVYWALVVGGQPDDMSRYTRIFGPPADDPQFFRLQALVLESVPKLNKAHEFWAKYENWIARTPDRWPNETGKRARALVFERMGRLARDWLADDGDDGDFATFLDFFERGYVNRPGQRRPLRPSAEECFRTAAELAPNWVKPAMELLQEYRGDPVKAHSAVAAILDRFPTNLTVLETAAEFYERIGDLAKSHDCIKRALAANPLDRDLRQRAAALAINESRSRAIDGDIEAARSALGEATHLSQPNSPAVLALSAAMEWRCGNVPEFERQRDALLSQPDNRLAAAYRLLVEGSRLKLKKKEIGPYQSAFTDGLAGPATSAELTTLLDAVAQYQQEPTKYRGLQAHAKNILERVVAAADMDEEDVLRIATRLHSYNLFKPLQEIVDAGIRRFQNNAYFYFFKAECMNSRRRTDYVNSNIGNTYRVAKNLMDMAKDHRYEPLRELLNERAKQIPDLERWLADREYW